MPKNQTNKLAIPLTLLFVFSSFLAPRVSLAQSAIGTAAIPPRLELTVNPGEVVTAEIKVRNESNAERFIDTTSRDFVVTNDRGTPIQVETNESADNRWAASNWIQVSPSQFKLKPGETKSLVLTVVAPSDAIAGGHYAMVVHTPQLEATLDESGSSIQAEVGTLVYITVPGDIQQNAKIKKFSAPYFSEYGPINFKTTINNLSDIHITPAGSITITNMLGGKTAKLALDETNIFPYTSRDFTNQLGKKWLFGRYKAQLNAAYGNTGALVSATIFFWVIPWRFILITGTSLGLAVVIVILLVKKNKTKTKSSETKIEQLEDELERLKNKYKDN